MISDRRSNKTDDRLSNMNITAKSEAFKPVQQDINYKKLTEEDEFTIKAREELKLRLILKLTASSTELLEDSTTKKKEK